MVSVMEHGISPTTTVTRMMASYGNPIQVGIAAGMLTAGDHHGGDHCLLLESIEAELKAAIGRPIAINIDGVSAALLSDHDLDLRPASPILMGLRTLALATHFIEE